MLLELPGLQSEFQDRKGYTKKPYLENQKQNLKKNEENALLFPLSISIQQTMWKQLGSWECYDLLAVSPVYPAL